MHVFATFFTMKVKLEDKMMQSNYLCVILHVKRKQLSLLTAFIGFLPPPPPPRCTTVGV